MWQTNEALALHLYMLLHNITQLQKSKFPWTFDGFSRFCFWYIKDDHLLHKSMQPYIYINNFSFGLFFLENLQIFRSKCFKEEISLSPLTFLFSVLESYLGKPCLHHVLFDLPWQHTKTMDTSNCETRAVKIQDLMIQGCLFERSLHRERG